MSQAIIDKSKLPAALQDPKTQRLLARAVEEDDYNDWIAFRTHLVHTGVATYVPGGHQYDNGQRHAGSVI